MLGAAESFFVLTKIKVGETETAPAPGFTSPIVKVPSGSKANAVGSDQVGPMFAQIEETQQGKGEFAGDDVLASLGGLTNGRHKICPFSLTPVEGLAIARELQRGTGYLRVV